MLLELLLKDSEVLLELLLSEVLELLLSEVLELLDELRLPDDDDEMTVLEDLELLDAELVELEVLEEKLLEVDIEVELSLEELLLDLFELLELE